EAFGNASNNFLRSFRSGLQEIISRTDPRRARQPARSIGRRLQTELSRGVGIQQIRLEYTVLDYDRTARGDAFAVEGRGAEPSDHRPIVNHRNVIAGDLLAQFARKKRCLAIDRFSVDAFKNMTDDRRRD